jgi:DNA uptake protein ComE-like DNA-binding protein
MCGWKRRLGLITLIACASAAAPGAQTVSPPATGSDLTRVAKNGLKGPVDLNTASAAALSHLPDITAAMAKKIIAGRPYASVDDLAKVGIATSTIGKIRPFVTAMVPNTGSPQPTTSARPSTTKPRSVTTTPDFPGTSGSLPR